jgi:hypothetical protein
MSRRDNWLDVDSGAGDGESDSDEDSDTLPREGHGEGGETGEADDADGYSVVSFDTSVHEAAPKLNESNEDSTPYGTSIDVFDERSPILCMCSNSVLFP